VKCRHPPPHYLVSVWVNVAQASLTAAALLASYIAHQRLLPFVAATTLSSSLQVQ
jgi:hypothetical protein